MTCIVSNHSDLYSSVVTLAADASRRIMTSSSVLLSSCHL